MAAVQPEQIEYYGACYEGAPDFKEATKRIQEKVKRYYLQHQTEIGEYDSQEYILDFCVLSDFVNEFL